jgi:hypothetical protein
MDHKYIREFDFVDRYLAGRLTADETAQFEEHFVGCTRCSEELSTTEDFIEGLRRARNDESAMTGKWAASGWIPALPLPVWISSAATLILIVAIAGGVMLFQRTRLSRIEADQAKSELSKREERLEEERQAASEAESKHKQAERELTERLTQLQAQLERKQGPTTTQNEPAQGPKVNLAILTLLAVRASETQVSANELVLPATATRFILSIGLEGKPAYKEYLITVIDDQDRHISKAQGLSADRYNMLTAEFASDRFRNGAYLLRLEGLSANGGANIVGEYPFRVSRSSRR